MSHAHLQLIRLSSLICLDVLGQSDPAGRHPAPVTWLMSKDLAERTGRTDGRDGFRAGYALKPPLFGPVLAKRGGEFGFSDTTP